MNKLAKEFKVVGNFINGKEIKTASKKSSPLHNPSLGVQCGEVLTSTAEDVKIAVDAATSALEKWSKTPPLVRARILFRFKDLCEQNITQIAELLTNSHGKVLADAQGEVTRGIEVIEFACGIPHLLKGEHSLNVGRNIDSWSYRQPLGVVSGITPFNFPAMVPLWMYPIAIACGNTFVLKASEKNPQTPMFIAHLFKEAGLPDGVLNLVNGGKEAVDALLEDKRVQALSFVGSTNIAEYVYQQGCNRGKRVQALGGAKNHLVVMPDADLDKVTDALMGAAYGSAGERCMAISVAVVVGDDTADKLTKKLSARAKNLKVGYGMDPQNEMGPLVSKEHLQKVQSYVDLGVQEGAELLVDGRNLKVDSYPQGFFIGACLFDKVKPNMRIYQEEIFGPVLSVMRAQTYEEAVQWINDHEYGNGVSIFTQNGGFARQFSEEVQVGMVGINIPIPVPMAFHSFGGWKRSIFGPAAMHGEEGVRFYTKLKTMTARWYPPTKAEFSMPTMK